MNARTRSDWQQHDNLARTRIPDGGFAVTPNPDTIRDITLGAPPATIAVLTVFGYSIADAVQAVMLVWALSLVVQKAWQFGCWCARRGWREWKQKPSRESDG